MTGNECMFYVSLTVFIILIIGYGSLRIWIEIRKRNVKRRIKESQVEEK